MALIDSELDDVGSFDDINETQQQQQQATAAEQTQNEVAAEKPPSKVPDKYSGKSLEEIVQMHQEAEKLIGRQAQEVGEVRKLADELLKQQLSSNKAAIPEENEIDFFEDPKKAVLQAVEKHPDVLAAKQAAQQLKQMQTQAMLQKKHPDFAEVVQDGEFIEWVKASPVRLDMYSKADSNFDFQSADELLSTFKQIRTVKTQQATTAAKDTITKSLKAAAVDVGGTGESSQKTYRRADLIRLRMNDPARYEALQPEIMAAYAAGRVK